ncbi:energy-coupling factor ABC transporter ATP-binding protein [Providencia alcalifaciens]|uniref:energy-coupling factor ABC transporter ATP-binding protein n=1 Tax=Providencia alcalifaciens TaxID=126385 RepID=UPI001CE1D8E6|nr:ABC transporter ATP-binding protein [Providencia alcalifaciens]UBX48760.1 energy-coupling factor ABC transporter ATP-binding protein [Providencia alcalifaciens]
MLQINQLSFQYTPKTTHAIEDLTLTLHTGEWVALVGDNGAGKSTLLRLMAGLLPPSCGEVDFNQQPISGLKAAERAQQIGILFQEAEKQIFHSSVKDEIMFGLRRQKLSSSDTAEKLERALTLCHLTDVADKHPLDLHSAQRRMVAVACLTAVQPKLLLLDEPSRDFDIQWLGYFEHWLDYQKQLGTTVVTISHDLDFAARHFSRAIHLSQGRLVADGNITTVLRHHELQPDSVLPSPTLHSLSHQLNLPIESQADHWVQQFLAHS